MAALVATTVNVVETHLSALKRRVESWISLSGISCTIGSALPSQPYLSSLIWCVRVPVPRVIEKLPYFSKPVDIRGTTDSATKQYDHLISISQAGWHWLQSSPLSATSFQISEFAGNTDNIEFKIKLPGE